MESAKQRQNFFKWNLLGFAVLVAVPCYAMGRASPSSQSNVKIPSDAKEIGNFEQEYQYANCDIDYGGVTVPLAGDCPAEATVSAAWEGTVDRIKQLPSFEELNTDEQCKKVYRRWSTGSPTRVFVEVPGANLPAGVCVSGRVDIYCEERDFAEQAAVSALQFCKAHPSEECFSERYKQMFKNITPTEYVDIEPIMPAMPPTPPGY